jgi:hypothetical protein
MPGKKFPGGRPDQRVAEVRREIARAVCGAEDYHRWRTTKWLRKRPLWLWNKVHHALCVAPLDPAVLNNLVTGFGIDGALQLQAVAKLGPPGRLALAEVLAGPTPAWRGPPWGSPWGSPWRIKNFVIWNWHQVELGLASCRGERMIRPPGGPPVNPR